MERGQRSGAGSAAEGTVGAASIEQQCFVIVLDPSGTDFATFRSCVENQFDLGDYSRAIPTPGQPVAIYQGPEGRQLRIEGQRIVIEGAAWEREAGRLARCLEELCAVTGVRVTASGVNPIFSVELSPAEAASELCEPGPRIRRLMGDQAAFAAVTVTAPRGSGRLSFEFCPGPGPGPVLRVLGNWHVDHGSVEECVRRLQAYPELVRELQRDLDAALEGIT